MGIVAAIKGFFNPKPNADLAPMAMAHALAGDAWVSLEWAYTDSYGNGTTDVMGREREVVAATIDALFLRASHERPPPLDFDARVMRWLKGEA